MDFVFVVFITGIVTGMLAYYLLSGDTTRQDKIDRRNIQRLVQRSRRKREFKKEKGEQ